MQFHLYLLLNSYGYSCYCCSHWIETTWIHLFIYYQGPGASNKITPIFQCPSFDTEEETTQTRLEIEQYFITAFRSYLPYGLNIAVKNYKDAPKMHFSSCVDYVEKLINS